MTAQLTKEETIVLTTLYNMCSGHFRTNTVDILRCFDTKKHQYVRDSLLKLKAKGIVYINDHPKDWNHFINWDVFNDEMIDQELNNIGL